MTSNRFDINIFNESPLDLSGDKHIEHLFSQNQNYTFRDIQYTLDIYFYNRFRFHYLKYMYNNV